MGEGVVGPAKVSMRTTQIYSCAGVAMVNKADQRGGLYHYPAQTLDNRNVSNTLASMAQEVKPDEIALTPASQMMGMPALSKSDGDELAKVLRKQSPNAEVHELEPSTFASLSWEDGRPFFGGHDRGDGEKAAVPNDYRETMATHSRPLQGDALYFGGNGEIKGVLDQDARDQQRR